MVNKKEKTTAVVIVSIMIALLLLIFLLPSALSGWAQSDLPVHDGDYIIWSVNGTRNGVNVSGVSIWTFSNVTAHSNDLNTGGYPRYITNIRTMLSSIVSDSQTAGSYVDSNRWSLGISPVVVEEGANSYSGFGSMNFVYNATISTAFGLKATAVYFESFNGPNYINGTMWIDASTGMPYKVQVTEPDTLNGIANELRGTLTFNIVASNMMH
jgi:hypothetical protein